MDIQSIQEVVKEILPKVVKKYGYSKFEECTPYIEYEKSIYARLAGEDDDGVLGEECPDAEYDRIDNSIIFYYPQMTSRKHIIAPLIHVSNTHLTLPTTTYVKDLV